MTTAALRSRATPPRTPRSGPGLRRSIAAGWCLAIGTLAPAQESGESHALGFCRSASGRALAAAEIWWLPREPTGIGWLDRRLPAAPPLRGTTDVRGRFRFEVPPTPALCVVLGPGGLGAVVPDAAPDAPLQIVAQPLGELIREDGRPFVGRIRLAADRPAPPLLPDQDGTKLALPAGDYLGWFGSPAVELAFHIDSATRTRWTVTEPTAPRRPTLPPPPASHSWIATGSVRWPLTLPCDPGTGVMPEPALPAAPDQLEAWLRGPSGDRLWTAAWPLRGVDGPTAPGPGLWIACRVAATGSAAGTETWMFTTALTAAGDVVVLAVDRVAADGTAHALLRDPADSTWPAATHLVLWSPGSAVSALALPSSIASSAPPLAVPAPGPAQSVRVRVLDAEGAPLAGAHVRLDPSRHPAVLHRDRDTDSSGLARLHGLLPDTASTLLVTHPRHLPRTLQLSAEAEAEVMVQLTAGLSVVGKVFGPDGHPAGGVGVELRETTAASVAGARRVSTGADGSFRFDGLPDGTFTLFTSRQVGATTWSGIRRGVQSGTGDEWRLDLRSEDPVPPGPRRDRQP